jgi:hypothetical protein
MNTKIKKLLIVLLVSTMLNLGAVSAYALYNPDSFYNNISWTWYYNAPYTNSYNCLGYATGSMTWEWPWGGNPTSSAVDSYLASLGYSTSGQWAYIISYGSTSAIKHFSKVTGEVWCRAKWGGLERFDHGSWNPYYAASVYGPKVQQYYLN